MWDLFNPLSPYKKTFKIGLAEVLKGTVLY